MDGYQRGVFFFCAIDSIFGTLKFCVSSFCSLDEKEKSKAGRTGHLECGTFRKAVDLGPRGVKLALFSNIRLGPGV